MDPLERRDVPAMAGLDPAMRSNGVRTRQTQIS